MLGGPGLAKKIGVKQGYLFSLMLFGLYVYDDEIGYIIAGSSYEIELGATNIQILLCVDNVIVFESQIGHREALDDFIPRED